MADQQLRSEEPERKALQMLDKQLRLLEDPIVLHLRALRDGEGGTQFGGEPAPVTP